MISAEALVALGAIDRGARYNTIHTTARELMGLGLACEDWGRLGITEAGRIFLRRGKFNIAIDDDNISDLSAHNTSVQIKRDPMAAPHRVHDEPLELLPEAEPTPLPVAETRMQEMLRAAGVASGKTGVWVDAKWLEEFARALDESHGEGNAQREPSASNTAL